MNALDRIFMNAAKSSTGACFLGALAGAALLSGCLGDPVASAKIDPSSPVAGEVAKLARGDKDYPSFSEIPPVPTDVRPARMYGERAAELDAARDELDRATAPNTWTLGNTTTFASRARSDAGPDYAAPAQGDTESFANTARKRATPPPPAKR